LTVSAWIKPDSTDGVVLARGGASHGYGIILKEGKAQFTLRVNNKIQEIRGGTIRPNVWQHVAGVLDTEKNMRLYIDGERVAEAPSTGFIAANPNEAMQIGIDTGSQLGHSKKSPPYTGTIDDVRIYHRPLAAREIVLLTQSDEAGPKDSLVLHYSFDTDDALDESGNGNHGGVGTTATTGKWGRGMTFGAPPVDRRGNVKLRRQVTFSHRWSHALSIYARAMVNTPTALFVAGPRDVIDEEKTYARPHDQDVKRMLAEQDAIMAGSQGAFLLAMDRNTGQELSRLKLDSPPVWDGMAAAQGVLVVSALDGTVTCLTGR